MKISKLFHWLYALVMLLPIFAIGVTCGYAMFNKNAYQSYGDEYIQNTQKVDNNSLLVNGEEYYISYRNVGNAQLYNDTKYYYSSISINWVDYGASSSNTYIGFMLNAYGNPNNRVYVYYLDNNNEEQRITLSIWGGSLKEFYFTLNNAVPFSTTNFENQPYNLYLINYKTNKISDVFYYSVSKVTQSNLFNWAYDSFLVAPFSYIVSLFSMPTNSPVVMLLSYWLAISIIWLVFDLVMYVPLLVHRWLDKGVIE